MERKQQHPSPENRDQDQGAPSLSETIPNAHAAGDGSLGRSEEATVEPKKTTKGDEAIKKEPEGY